MSIRPISTIPVDTSRLEFKSLGTNPKLDYESGQQQVDKVTSLPLWSIDALATYADGTTAIASVTVPSKEAPMLPLLTVVTFVALRAFTFGTAGLLFRAESASAPRPNQQRAE